MAARIGDNSALLAQPHIAVFDHRLAVAGRLAAVDEDVQNAFQRGHVKSPGISEKQLGFSGCSRLNMVRQGVWLWQLFAVKGNLGLGGAENERHLRIAAMHWTQGLSAKPRC
jgi:hypothetical protein